MPLATREMNFVHAKYVTLNHVEKTEEIPLTPVNSETEFAFKNIDVPEERGLFGVSSSGRTVDYYIY